MSRKRDVLLIMGILLVAGLLFLIIQYQQHTLQPLEQIRIYVDGQLYTQAPLCGGERIVIDQGDGMTNTLTMTKTGFYMSHSTCKSQSCVHQGEVNTENYVKRTLGTHIFCLPHRIDAELVLTDAPAPDAIVPDV